jgi:protease-4
MKRQWLVCGLAFLGGLVLFLILLSFIFALLAGYKHFGLGKPKIGVLEIKGVILDADEYLSAIREFRTRRDVKAVLVRVESPGGAIGPTQEVFEELKKLRKEKPIYVSMGGVSASGGYYVSLAGEKIFANPGTITGSIGVVIELPNLEKLFEKLGIKSETIKSGEFKDTGSIYRGLTKEEREYLKAKVNQLHDQFVRVVAEERKLPLDKVKSLADGRIYTGEEAKALKLIDDLGNYYTALEELKKRINLKEAEILVLPRKKGFWERFFGEKTSLSVEKLLQSLYFQPFYLIKLNL